MYYTNDKSQRLSDLDKFIENARTQLKAPPEDLRFLESMREEIKNESMREAIPCEARDYY